MKWEKSYEIGIREIDHQHMQLVELICRYKNAISDKTLDIDREMGRIITFLVNYANYHFEAEEGVMIRIGYPDLEQHKSVHKDLVRQLKEVLVKLKTKQSYTPIEFYYFLMKWLTNHILDEDKKVGKFNNQVKPEKTELKNPQDILDVFKTSFNKLELMRKNNLITDKDKDQKRFNFIKKFYKIFQISDMKQLLLALDSVFLLVEKEYLAKTEYKTTVSDIMDRVNLDELIEKGTDIVQNLETLKVLADRGLVTDEYYEKKKNSLIERI